MFNARAKRAIDALRKPDASLAAVANTVRQSIAEVIEELLLEWQPIETAPRDGTKIIVFRPIFDGTYIPRVGVDWFGLYGGEGTWGRSRKDTPPTHWMPFPAPPLKAAVSATKGK